MFKQRVLSVWGSLAVLAVGWVVAGVAVIAQRQAEAQQRRVDQAPACEASQVFSGVTCRAVVDGTVTALSTRQAEVDTGGRHLTVAVSLHQVDGSVPGTPVQVTVYRGAPIRLDGDHVHINAEDSPADRLADAREFARAAMFLGTFLGGGNLIIALAVRWSNRRRPTVG
ncbi:hypothetical protein AB0K00_57200 [Dactylosporangium sp. NPDC049525]|uniref:hypothetical protein n=1 Tax=Dactylosporangium sp. NPDC049525 TaxID=3154730 RepID=UPI00342C6ABF